MKDKRPHRTPLKSLNMHLAEYAGLFDVYFAEHLVCLFDENKLNDLIVKLGISDPDALLQKLLKCKKNFLQNFQQIGFASGLRSFGCSASHEALHQFKPLPWHTLNLPKKVDLLDRVRFTPIRDQGGRGTCTSHSVVKALEVTQSYTEAHSPAFNRFFTKLIENNDHEGATINAALEAIKRYGSCEDRLADYQSYLTDPQFAPSDIARHIAKQNRFDDWVCWTPDKHVIAEAQLLLSGGLSGKPRPIVAGIRLAKSSIDNLYSNLFGEWSKPFEKPSDSASEHYLHAMLVIGVHRDTDNTEGYVYLVNSWGSTFAKHGDYGPGIAKVSLSFFEQNCVAIGTLLYAGEKTQYFCEAGAEPLKSAAYAKPDNSFRFELKPFANNHIGIFGPSGSGKTTLGCSIVESAILQQESLTVHDVDLQREKPERLAHLSPKVLNVEEVGLPFPLISQLRGTAGDIKARSLSNDLQASSLALGVHQIEQLNRVLEIAINVGIESNLDLKQFLLDELDGKSLNHLADFLILLRSNETLNLNRAGLYVHDLSAFDELPSSRSLYAIALLRYCKNIQFEDASSPCMFVMDELDLLLEGKSHNALKRFLQEGRKLNMCGVFASQVKPSHRWFIDNLQYVQELTSPLAEQPERVPINYRALKNANFQAPIHNTQATWWKKVLGD